MNKNVLMVCPHPDDVFISCAGFIKKNIDKYNFTVLCLTSSGYQYERRIKEEKNAWMKVSNKIEVKFEKNIDTSLQEDFNCLVKTIESYCKKLNPQIIFTPYYEDTHQDHVAVSKATMAAGRYEKNIIFYETPSTFNFYPTIFCELNEEIIKEKTDISREYNSQLLGNTNYQTTLYELIKANALSNGVKSRVCKYAEGFKPFKFFLE